MVTPSKLTLAISFSQCDPGSFGSADTSAAPLPRALNHTANLRLGAPLVVTNGLHLPWRWHGCNRRARLSLLSFVLE